MEAFTVHRGMPRLANRDNQTPWEQQLTTYFLQGLLPAISAATKLSCVGWKKARLETVADHAHHAMERQSAREENSAAEKRATAAAQLTMMQAVTQAAQSQRGRGQPRRGNQGGNGCFICGSLDHLARDCPQKQPDNQRGGGRSRGERRKRKRTKG